MPWSHSGQAGFLGRKLPNLWMSSVSTDVVPSKQAGVFFHVLPCNVHVAILELEALGEFSNLSTIRVRGVQSDFISIYSYTGQIQRRGVNRYVNAPHEEDVLISDKWLNTCLMHPRPSPSTDLQVDRHVVLGALAQRTSTRSHGLSYLPLS